MKLTKKQRIIAAAVMATILVAAIICGVIRNSHSVPSNPIDDIVVDTVVPSTTPSTAPSAIPAAPAAPAAPSIAAPAPATDIGDPSVVVVGPDCGTSYYTPAAPATVEETVTLSAPAYDITTDKSGNVAADPAHTAPSTEEEWEAIYGYDYSSRNDDTPEVPYEQYSSEESLEDVVVDEPSEVAPLEAVEECEDTPDAAPEEVVAEDSFSYEEDDSDDSATFEEAALQEDAPDEQPAEAPAAEAVEDTPDAPPAVEAAPVEAPAVETAPAVDATPVVETAPAVEAAPAVDTVVEAAPAADVAVDAVAW